MMANCHRAMSVGSTKAPGRGAGYGGHAREDRQVLPMAAGPCLGGTLVPSEGQHDQRVTARPHRPEAGSRTPRGPRTSRGRPAGAPGPPPAARRRRRSTSTIGLSVQVAPPGLPVRMPGQHDEAVGVPPRCTTTGKRKTRPVRTPVTASATRPPSTARAGFRARREDRTARTTRWCQAGAVQGVEERPADHAEGGAGHEPGDRPGRHDPPPRPARRAVVAPGKMTGIATVHPAVLPVTHRQG